MTGVDAGTGGLSSGGSGQSTGGRAGAQGGRGGAPLTGSGGAGGPASSGGAPGTGGRSPTGSGGSGGGVIAGTGGAPGTGGAQGTGGAACQPKPRDCTSALDNDCNGKPDKQETATCACAVGDTQPCGTHSGKDGMGICKAGTQTCTASADKTTSAWGQCNGSVGPSTRNCTSSVDNDCNGTPDSQELTYCACSSGGTQSCGMHAGKDGIGVCKAGTQTCAASADKTTSAWGQCNGSVGPGARDCTSAADNDCNGTADKQETSSCACAVGTSQPCGTHPGKDGVGICKAGSQTCTASADKTTSTWGQCNGSIGPATQVCTSTADNDCNGTPDIQDCYGTTVVAGTVTCGGGPGKKQCSASVGCGWTPRVDNPAGSCGNPGSGNYYMTCDGPNDCPGGVCCAHGSGFISGGLTCYAGNQSGVGGCPPDDSETYVPVCDPLNDKCPAGYHCVFSPTSPTNYWAQCMTN